MLLLRAGWNELLIAAFSHRSIDATNGIVLATGLTVYRYVRYLPSTVLIFHTNFGILTFSRRDSANQFGVGGIFDRVLTELVAKMREMKMDKTELGCLRTIILFNPGRLCYFYVN